jgi:hypothetical protein
VTFKGEIISQLERIFPEHIFDFQDIETEIKRMHNGRVVNLGLGAIHYLCINGDNTDFRIGVSIYQKFRQTSSSWMLEEGLGEIIKFITEYLRINVL